ncbi:M56 family metallopeptidase [Phenylobacterium sp.]|uniref:M56 family metallopeptidase n=1 Tax=Phenylobacterium sp. TaxID=1871053 RepID=UPI0025D27282|nr:M56 family metallopeptidase [Phenylobacterium sp.]
MTSEVLAGLLRANLVLAIGILAVMALRRPARRVFGPEVAYGLWAIPPLAALASLMPARVEDDAPQVHAFTAALADVSAPALIAWAAGALLLVAGLARAQAMFMADARRGKAGPAVVGVITPRVLMPADDGTYTAEERALIRAHEREHVARRDPRAGAVAAALQALCWFNPLVHLGAHLMRLDQELACDAAVLRRRPHDRALYARTLLKTQLAAQPLPFGCYWPAAGLHPLEVRVAQMKVEPRFEAFYGALLVASAVASAVVAAWNLQPPAPRPGELVDLWQRQQRHPVTSVMLVSLPPRPAAETPDR